MAVRLTGPGVETEGVFSDVRSDDRHEPDRFDEYVSTGRSLFRNMGNRKLESTLRKEMAGGMFFGNFQVSVVLKT